MAPSTVRLASTLHSYPAMVWNTNVHSITFDTTITQNCKPIFQIKIHGWLHLTNSHGHYPSKTEGKKLKEQTNARQFLVASRPQQVL